MIYIKFKYLVFIPSIVGILLGLLFDFNKLQNKEVSNVINNNKSSTTNITTVNINSVKTTIITTKVKPSKVTKQEIINPKEYTIETECIKETEDYYNSVQEDENADNYFNYEEYDNESEIFFGWYTAKWYTGSIGTYGYSGIDLISGYSVASSDFPQGSLLKITGGGLDGIYRVDDTGCPSGVIDFFYHYGEVPEHFEFNGVYDIQVSIIE